MTVLVKIAFDGTNYRGFQIQNDAVTVFGTFQQALLRILGHETQIKGCSRTDSGVHAKCFYLSFDTPKQLDLRRLPLALNGNLPPDIRALEAVQVPDGFHARYDAKGKEYTYYILNSHIDSPFFSGYYYKVAAALDVESMQQAAKNFVGKWDFSAFMSKNSSVTDFVRTVYYADVKKDGDMIKFVVRADGFLYNMVRIMAGTLVSVGRGQIKAEDIPRIIQGRDRSAAGPTAPAQGLFLTDVFY